MPIIYIDILFILNLWVDFLLLSATARLRRLPVKRWRLLFGAAVGALGSCLLFLPPLSWWGALLIRVPGTALLAVITFPMPNLRRGVGDTITLTVLCAVFSGTATMLWYIAAPNGFLVVNGVVYYDAPASLLILFTAVSYVAVCVFDRLTRRKTPQGRGCTLLLRHGGREVACACLYDSGCTLREPFSGKPAVVIDATAVHTVLPPDWQRDSAAATAAGTRFVPFKSLGGDGLLPAFLPDYMAVVDTNGKRLDITGSYLALGEGVLNGEYTALIGTDIGDMMG